MKAILWRKKYTQDAVHEHLVQDLARIAVQYLFGCGQMPSRIARHKGDSNTLIIVDDQQCIWATNCEKTIYLLEDRRIFELRGNFLIFPDGYKRNYENGKTRFNGRKRSPEKIKRKIKRSPRRVKLCSIFCMRSNKWLKGIDRRKWQIAKTCMQTRDKRETFGDLPSGAELFDGNPILAKYQGRTYYSGRMDQPIAICDHHSCLIGKNIHYISLERQQYAELPCILNDTYYREVDGQLESYPVNFGHRWSTCSNKGYRSYSIMTWTPESGPKHYDCGAVHLVGNYVVEFDGDHMRCKELP